MLNHVWLDQLVNLIRNIFEIPLKKPLAVGAGYTTFSSWAPVRTQLMMIRMHAIMVVMRAPTAMGQKSLGVPIQVRGVRAAATITIQVQRLRWRPAPAISEPVSCEMRTMKTQPPPYRVRVIETTETMRPHLPTAFSPMAGYGSLTWPRNSSYLIMIELCNKS